MRLDGKTFPRHFPRFFYYYPQWASYPPQYAPALEEVAKLKKRAEAILNGEERPPPWLVKKEPERWTPTREVETPQFQTKFNNRLLNTPSLF